MGIRNKTEWDQYFLDIAEAVKTKSKDPNCRVGAVIVNSDRLVISTGFNGIARLLDDDADMLNNKTEKLDWVVHAEHNAILNAARTGVTTRQGAIFVTKFPCFSCLLAIVQAGIETVCTDDDEYWSHDPLDREHRAKRHVLSQLTVVAPNHPSWRPGLPSCRSNVPPPSQTH